MQLTTGRKIKIRCTTPAAVRATLEKNGWFQHIWVNNEITYKKAELSNILQYKPREKDQPEPVVIIQPKEYSYQAASSVSATLVPPLVVPNIHIQPLNGGKPLTEEELERRCVNVTSMYPNPQHFIGPIRQRLHNLAQSLSGWEREFVEAWAEENHPWSVKAKI